MRRRRRLVKSKARQNGSVIQRRRHANGSGQKSRSQPGHGGGKAGRQAGLLQLQRSHGNAFVGRLLASENATDRKRTQLSGAGHSGVSMSEIRSRARSAAGKKGAFVSFAGTPDKKDAPGGLADILKKSGGGTIGTAGGLTIAYDDFKKPRLKIDVESKKEGNKTRYFAKLQSTSAKDARHDSYYPGPGLHQRPGLTHKDKGKTYHYYWRIKDKTSDLIKKGEQEHLNDHERAYELVYGRVVKEINALAGKKIGPAGSESAARKKARARLAAKLPAVLGTSPAKWHKKLIELIKVSEVRDKRSWHALDGGPLKTEGDKLITPVDKTSKTKIGVVPSSKVVKL